MMLQSRQNLDSCFTVHKAAIVYFRPFSHIAYNTIFVFCFEIFRYTEIL